MTGMEGAACSVSPPPHLFNMDEGNEQQPKGGLRTGGLTVPSGQLKSIKRSSSSSGEREGKELSSSGKGTYREWNDHPPCSTETSGPANVTRTRGSIHKDEEQCLHSGLLGWRCI